MIWQSYVAIQATGLSAGDKLANRKESQKRLKTFTEPSQLPVMSRRGMQVCSLYFEHFKNFCPKICSCCKCLNISQELSSFTKSNNPVDYIVNIGVAAELGTTWDNRIMS